MWHAASQPLIAMYVVTSHHVHLLMQISGLAFFLVALIGAISVITGFLAALYGTSAAGLYAAVSLVSANSRLQAPQSGRGGHIRYHSD